MKTPLIACFTFLSIMCFAQKDYLSGYVVTNEGDTLTGQIRDRRSVVIKIYTKIRFIDDDRGWKKKLSPNQIRAYSRGDELFVSRDYNGKKVFLKLVEEGPVNLYHHLTVDDDSFLLEKKLLQREGSSHYAHIIGIGFRKKLTNYFSDCFDLIDKVHRREFRYKTLRSAVQYYNEHCGATSSQ